MADFATPQLSDMEDAIVERFTTTRDYKDKPPGKPSYDSIDLGKYLQDQTKQTWPFPIAHSLLAPPKPIRQIKQMTTPIEAIKKLAAKKLRLPNQGQIEDTRLILVTDLRLHR